jgi:hypothetical protein
MIIAICVLGLRTAPVVAWDVHSSYDPRDSAPVSIDGVWLGRWYVTCSSSGPFRRPWEGRLHSGVLALAAG